MFRHFTTPAAIAFSVALLSPAFSSAEIVFSNFGASLSYNITQGNVVGNDFAGDNVAEGDTFKPSSNATFTSLQLALSCSIATCPDFYTVDLTGNAGDQPGTVLESFSGAGSSLGQLNVNNAPVLFTSTGSPITLVAGTQYWVTVSSDVNNAIAWNLNTTGDASDQAISTDGGGTYFSPSGLTPSAYQVNGTAVSGAPEPGTTALVTGALPILWMVRRSLLRRKESA